MASSVLESRHVACARCRDRKVKCDGAKPSCRRCSRNGTSCQYIRGRKQQTKSEWVQHLRTFSCQPGRTNTAGQLDSPPSKSTVPQTPHTRPQSSPFEDSLAPITRSPSPYLLEHSAFGMENGHCLNSAASSPYDSYASIEGWSGLWLPASPEQPLVEAQPFSFEPSSTFYHTNFTSELLTTTSSQSCPPLYQPLMGRSPTPVSQASEATPSLDGSSEYSLPYDNTSYCIPPASEPAPWGLMPVYDEHTNPVSLPYW